ncbi:MAG: TonB-dependent receptor [Gammaproteobacteria bacterium]|nr:TonB-dependent receptor [Gammaproteobacteria bacterium]
MPVKLPPPLTIRLLGHAAAALLAALCGLPASAAEPKAQELSVGELLGLELETLFDVHIKTATKLDQKAVDAPAVVSVVGRDDIELWHYRSVAEALHQVPGLYGIDDYFSPNLGVRGINGGLRGYSKELKLMIDGQPVSFRTDGTNYLGPELIPMELVERIEIVRGPASALYGANAFLGVVNVITRRAVPASLSARAHGRYGYGLSGAYAHAYGPWQLQLAASGERVDNAKASLPESSPFRSFFADRRSDEAATRPLSGLGQLRYAAETWQAELVFHYSRLSSEAEFLDFGTLTHENRVALEQSTTAARLEWQLGPTLTLRLNAALAQGEPGADERLSLGAARATYPRRDFAYDAKDAGAELHYALGGQDSLSLGLDWTSDREELLRIYSVDKASGRNTLVSLDQGTETLANRGVYLQYVSYPWDALGLTANLRRDRHSMFGSDTNYRVGAVYHWTPRLVAKLLQGTSYKAPAAGQLFAQPLYPGEIIGNQALSAETAKTTELALSWQIADAFELQLNAFDTELRDKVELLLVGSNFQPNNVGRVEGRGGEMELGWARQGHSLHAALAYQDMETTLRHPFRGELTTPTDLYPRYSAHLRWQYEEPGFGRFGLALAYASPRRASAANIRANFQTPYQLEDYWLVHGVYGKSWGPHHAYVKVDNLLDEDYAEPGFNGIDFPGRGREWTLGYEYHF